MRQTALIAVLLLTAQPAYAADLTMTCQNSRRSYDAVYSPFARTFIAKADDGDTPYRVDDVKTVAGETSVIGATVEGGPTYKAQFGRTKSITFYDGGKAVQVDKCH